ncbi:unnamed protein product [Phytomonas sp. Hart1]|nr:unnamed protein product [Phytomonas sp. Hart1]|eukprot:CCW71281.1 unnamed protein product [Phytomonas sp. isolate Hart1]
MTFYEDPDHPSCDVSRATLLPLRSRGLPKDISNVIKSLLCFQENDFFMVPRSSSMTKLGTSPPKRGSPYSRAVNVPSPRRSALQFKQRVHVNSTSGSPPSSRSPSRLQRKCTLPVSADGLANATERTRYRNEVTRKLLSMYAEILQLNQSSDRMCQQLTEAMRTDPRYAKEKGGTVRSASKPTDQQEKALSGFVSTLATLHEASVELVAAYLTPEEKRFLGLNSHLFQTQQAKASTYQYISHFATGKRDPKKRSKPNPTEAREEAQPSGGSASPVPEVQKVSSAVLDFLAASRLLKCRNHNDKRSADLPTDRRPQQLSNPSLRAYDDQPSRPAASALTTPQSRLTLPQEPVATAPGGAILPESTPERTNRASGSDISLTSERHIASETSLAPPNAVPLGGSPALIPPTEASSHKNEPPSFKIINGKRHVLTGKMVPLSGNDILTHHMAPPVELVDQKNLHASTLPKIRPEFKHLQIDSDSDSSTSGSH